MDVWMVVALLIPASFGVAWLIVEVAERAFNVFTQNSR